MCHYRFTYISIFIRDMTKLWTGKFPTSLKSWPWDSESDHLIKSVVPAESASGKRQDNWDSQYCRSVFSTSNLKLTFIFVVKTNLWKYSIIRVWKKFLIDKIYKVQNKDPPYTPIPKYIWTEKPLFWDKYLDVMEMQLILINWKQRLNWISYFKIVPHY